MDEHTDFKKFSFQVRITFETLKKFKDVVTRYALAQGYDLTFSLLDKNLKKVIATSRSGCKFRVCAFRDRRRKHMWLK